MRIAIATLLLTVACGAQTPQTANPRTIDWSKCQKVTAAWQTTIDKFNADPERKKDGLQIQAGCTFSVQNAKPNPPDKKIPLTREEIDTLNALRRTADAAFAAQSAYERLLMAKRGLEEWSVNTKPCTLTAMIRVADDYITLEGSPLDENFYDCPKPKALEAKSK